MTMGLWSYFRTGAAAPAPVAARVEPPLVASATAVQSESQWRGLAVGGVSRSGVRVNERMALSIPATLQALRIISGVFAMAPLHLYQRTDQGRVRMDGHPAEMLLAERPNSHQSPFALFEMVMSDLLLAGNFYAYVSRNQRGDPVALTRLKPGTVLVAEYFDRAEGQILFYDATLPDGSRERFAGRDVWHVAGLSRDGLIGLSPVQYAREALGGAIATADHTNRFWNKGGRPSTVLTTEQKVGPEDKVRIRADWEKLYAGPDASAVAVLDQDLKAVFLTHNLKDSQFLETRQFQVVDLARIWGVPPHLIFELSKATFSNIEQQSLEFVTYHLGPHFARVAGAATRQFGGDGLYFEHLTDALVRGDLKSRMEAYWLQRQMGIANGNELRRRENQNDIPGAAGSEYWRPANMAVAGQPVDTTQNQGASNAQ
ncbi:portal protein [Rhodobacter phage RcNL1]|nr:portal protein [Rhodobacter phage RcNL1]